VSAEPQEASSALRLLFNRFPGAVWAVDTGLRITYAVGHVPARHDFHGSSLVDKTIAEVVGARDATEPVVAHHLAALTGQAQSFRYNLAGREHEVSVHPLWEGTHVVGCVGAALDVTERLRTQERLARSEASMAEAQRVAHVGSFEWELATDRMTWSDEMYRIYGLGKCEFDGTFEAFLRRVAPADTVAVKSAFLDILRKPQAFAQEYRILRGTEERRIHSRGQVLEDEHGHAQRLVGTSWDVTNVRETTERLKETVSTLEATLEATADGILVVDLEGKIVAFNTKFLSLWNIPAELARQGNDQALLSYVVDQLDDPERFLAGVRAVNEDLGGQSFDKILFRDGRIYERYSRPQLRGGIPSGRVWSFRDATGREQSLRQALYLSDASRLLSSLQIESALEAVARLSVGRVAGGCAVDMLEPGRSNRLVAVSGNAARPLPEEVHPTVLAGHALLFNVGSISYASVPLMAERRVAAAMTFTAPGSRAYSRADLELFEELAQRASLSLENARLYERAGDAIQARDEFLSLAAHELRGPLTSVRLAAQSLLRNVAKPEDQAKMLEIIIREDRRLASFVDELLDIGAIRAGRLAFELRRLNLAELVYGAVDAQATEAARSGTLINVSTFGDTTGEWDSERLGEVITQLLDNAIKFGRGQPVTVTVDGRQECVSMEVKDAGIGIPQEMLPRIFEPFERGVSARHYGGLGLGLYIARTNIEAMGGSLSASSETGLGSTFRFELPREGSAHA
jgi:signal transduction histidine kinase